MENKILVYDDNCPLCACYSLLFVRCGLLPANGRKPFSAIAPELLEMIDFDRSRHEIPLIDISTRKTLYGIDALLELLAQKISIIKTIGQWTPVHYLLKKLYKFISYNRKVIVAVACGQGKIDCAPDINYFYRYAFIVFFFLMNALLLSPLHTVLMKAMPAANITLPQILLSYAAIMLFNGALAATLKKQSAVALLGQATMLSLLALLLVLPLRMVYLLAPSIPVAFLYAYLFAVAAFIAREYIRRMNYIDVLSSSNWMAGLQLAGTLLFVFLTLHR